jgi:UDP-3-O-[3-hydroxymyristoyl] glucosamine N-acyltransferase
MFRCGVAALMALAGPRLARANGDDFFNNPLDAQVPINEQMVFIGNVRDDKGNVIENAAINLKVAIPPGFSLEPVTFSAYSNVIGRYRTLDVLSVVASMIGADVDLAPQAVELTVKKAGYVMSRRMSRARASQRRGLFEVNFVLEKA